MIETVPFWRAAKSSLSPRERVEVRGKKSPEFAAVYELRSLEVVHKFQM
jgi:hypothetical protein